MSSLCNAFGHRILYFGVRGILRSSIYERPSAELLLWDERGGGGDGEQSLKMQTNKNLRPSSFPLKPVGCIAYLKGFFHQHLRLP